MTASNGPRRRKAIGLGLFFTLSTLFTLLAGAPVRAADDDGDDDAPWKVRWDDGIRVESADERFAVTFGGGIQADWTYFDQDRRNETFYGPAANGNEFRQARFHVLGTLYQRVRFKAQYDFAESEADIKDLYVEFIDTRIGNIRVGHFREPFSLEEQTEGRHTAFLERSLPNLFAPGRNTGAMLYGRQGEQFTWAIGAFRETDVVSGRDTAVTDDDSGGKLNVTLRLTRLTLYEDDGKRLVHLGLSATHKDLGMDRFRFRTRPEVQQNSRYFLETGLFRADETRIYGIEAAGVAGRFWAAAELMTARPENADFGTRDPVFEGGYIHVGFFLTADHRRYDTTTGAFTRTRPNRNFGDEGAGAWEIALRYSKLDLSDAIPIAFRAGKLDNLTLGVNWYPNPASRVMLNYIKADPNLQDFSAGSADHITLRFQVDF